MSNLDFTPEPEGPGCAPVALAIGVFMAGAIGAGISFVAGGAVWSWVGSVALMCGGIFLFVRITR